MTVCVSKRGPPVVAVRTGSGCCTVPAAATSLLGGPVEEPFVAVVGAGGSRLGPAGIALLTGVAVAAPLCTLLPTTDGILDADAGPGAAAAAAAAAAVVTAGAGVAATVAVAGCAADTVGVEGRALAAAAAGAVPEKLLLLDRAGVAARAATAEAAAVTATSAIALYSLMRAGRGCTGCGCVSTLAGPCATLALSGTAAAAT